MKKRLAALLTIGALYGETPGLDVSGAGIDVSPLTASHPCSAGIETLINGVPEKHIEDLPWRDVITSGHGTIKITVRPYSPCSPIRIEIAVRGVAVSRATSTKRYESVQASANY